MASFICMSRLKIFYRGHEGVSSHQQRRIEPNHSPRFTLKRGAFFNCPWSDFTCTYVAASGGAKAEWTSFKLHKENGNLRPCILDKWQVRLLYPATNIQICGGGGVNPKNAEFISNKCKNYKNSSCIQTVKIWPRPCQIVWLTPWCQ